MGLGFRVSEVGKIISTAIGSGFRENGKIFPIES